MTIPARRRPSPVLVAEAAGPLAPTFIPLPVIETEPSLFARTPLAEGPTRLSLTVAPQPQPLFVTARSPVLLALR